MNEQLELAVLNTAINTKAQITTMDHDSKSSSSDRSSNDSSGNSTGQTTETVYSQSGSDHSSNRDSTNRWISAFNTSLLTTRATAVTDQSQEIGRLMGTPEFASLLVAAQHLAKTQNLSEEESTERLIDLFRAIDHAWSQVVMSRGLNSLIGKD
jgi:hypothetical protein